MSNSSNRSKVDLWDHQIENWKASGLSQKKWCEENTVSLSSLKYWLAKRGVQKAADPQFTEIVDQFGNHCQSGLQLRIGSATIELATNFDEGTLRRLVKVLGDAT